MMGTKDEFLTYEEAAKRYGVADITVRKWVRAGLIKRYRRPMDKHVYVKPSEIDRFKHATPQPEQNE